MLRRCISWAAVVGLAAMMSAVLAPTTASAAVPRSLDVAGHSVRRHSAAKQGRSPAEGKGDGHYCNGCTPPLVYSGGPVMETSGSNGVTITPIYWIPDGSATPFPDDYQTIINGYITDVAAASGSTDNVYSINAEYFQTTGGLQHAIAYQIKAGTPIVDTAPFPKDGCTPGKEYTGCITDAQLRTELSRITKANGLTTDLANFYPLFFPPGIETQDVDGSNSDSSYCGYHRAFGSGSDEIVYGNEPFEKSGCDAGQAPNGDVIADGAVGTLSHEVNEALTDPTDTAAWNDSTGHEIGDICANDYGTAIGSTDPSNPSKTEYNQVINGNKYYTQTEFSNQAFATFGFGKGCVQNEAAAAGAGTPDASTAVGSVFTFAYPNTVPADGKSTSAISTSVSDLASNVITGDTVNFSVYAVTGTGECGTLSADHAVTGDDGFATVSYVASSSDVTCAVVATDTQGGQASTGTVYQGSMQQSAPTASDTFPTSFQPGADAKTFTTSFTNSTATPLVNVQIDFSLFPADKVTTDVTAAQVHLSASTAGASGPFMPVSLTGSTVKEGAIQGRVGAQGGTKLAAGDTVTITYQMSLDTAVPSDVSGPLMSIEVYLDQVNPASGAGTNIADTGATNISVTHVSTDSANSIAGVDITAVSDTAAGSTVQPFSDTTAGSTAGAASTDAASTDAAATAGASTNSTSPDASTTAESGSSSGSGAVVVIIIVVVIVVLGAGGVLMLRRRRRPV